MGKRVRTLTTVSLDVRLDEGNLAESALVLMKGPWKWTHPRVNRSWERVLRQTAMKLMSETMMRARMVMMTPKMMSAQPRRERGTPQLLDNTSAIVLMRCRLGSSRDVPR